MGHFKFLGGWHCIYLACFQGNSHGWDLLGSFTQQADLSFSLQRHGSQLTFCLLVDFNTNVHYSKQWCKNKGEQQNHLKSYTTHTAPLLIQGLKMKRGFSNLHLHSSRTLPTLFSSSKSLQAVSYNRQQFQEEFKYTSNKEVPCV